MYAYNRGVLKILYLILERQSTGWKCLKMDSGADGMEIVNEIPEDWFLNWCMKIS